MRLFSILFLAACTLLPMTSKAVTMEELNYVLNHHEASYLTKPLVGKWQSTTTRCGGSKCQLTINAWSTHKAEMFLNGDRYCLQYIGKGLWAVQNVAGTRTLGHLVMRNGKLYDDKNNVTYARTR